MSENKTTAISDNVPVWRRIDYTHDALIEASAGTGKTFTLENIVLTLLGISGENEETAENAPEKIVDSIKNILLVTFTEKAAGELRDRIRGALTKAGCMPRDFDEATICTIHSFCREILREYAFENNVPMNFDMASSDEELIHRAVRNAVLSEEFEEEHRSDFTLLMEAGGLSSTDELVERAQQMLQNFLTESGTESDTYEKNDELTKKISAILSKISETAAGIREAGTISSYFKLGDFDGCIHATSMKSFGPFLESLQQEIDKAGEDCKSGIFQIADKYKDKISTCGNPRLKAPYTNQKLFDQRKAYQDFILSLQELEECLREILTSHLTAIALQEFRRMKANAGYMTFDDLVTKTAEVIEHEETDSAFLNSVRKHYRVALVDEFQDTDSKQWGIFHKLFSSSCNVMDDEQDAPEPKQGFLLVVGDPKQAIYSFRGADIKVYEEAKKGIQAQQSGSKLTLNKTYRSTKELIEAFNLIFGQTGWFARTDAQGEDGKISYEEVSYPDKNERFEDFKDPSGRGPVTLLESLHVQSEQKEAGRGGNGTGGQCIPVFMENAANEMKRLHGMQYSTKTDEKTGTAARYHYGDMCVLVRKTSEAETVKRILSAKRIPYSHYKEQGVYKTEAAEAFLALFDYLAEPGRDGNLAALLLTPLFGVALAELEPCLSAGNAAYTQILEKWQILAAKKDWNRLFESVMNESRLGEGESDDFEFDRFWAASRQILDKLLEHQGRAALSVEDFAKDLRAMRKDDSRAGENGALRQKENEANSVQIMTIHASKGLEFKIVFLASGFGSAIGKDGATPEQKLARVQEEKRLLYVALTRAEHKLYLPWSQYEQHLRNGNEEHGIGSKDSPLLIYGEYGGFLAKAIMKYREELQAQTGEELLAITVPETEIHTKTETSGESAGEIWNPVVIPDGIDMIQSLKWFPSSRLQWDSFSSMKSHHGAEITPEDDSSANDEEAITNTEELPRIPTLLPRDTVSGHVFHEIMETLCKNDDTEKMPGFATAGQSSPKVLNSNLHFMDIVRRTMKKHGLGNQKRKNVNGEIDSTEQVLVRMVWNALNTEIKVGSCAFYLKDIGKENRRAEVEFVMDEGAIFPEEEMFREDRTRRRDGIFNGQIDLLIRPEGKTGKVYLIDWKTNSLPNYDTGTITQAMDEAGYPLQFKLYTLAVNRWLGEGKTGGIAYLFVRSGENGIPDEKQNGVYVQTMSEELLEDCRRSVLKNLSRKDTGKKEL